MKRVLKYNFEIKDNFIIRIPKESKILDVSIRNNPVMWCLVPDGNEITDRRFRMVRTGHLITDNEKLSYVKTIQSGLDEPVWHLFEYVF